MRKIFTLWGVATVLVVALSACDFQARVESKPSDEAAEASAESSAELVESEESKNEKEPTETQAEDVYEANAVQMINVDGDLPRDSAIAKARILEEAFREFGISSIRGDVDRDDIVAFVVERVRENPALADALRSRYGRDKYDTVYLSTSGFSLERRKLFVDITAPEQQIISFLATANRDFDSIGHYGAKAEARSFGIQLFRNDDVTLYRAFRVRIFTNTRLAAALQVAKQHDVRVRFARPGYFRYSKGVVWIDPTETDEEIITFLLGGDQQEGQ